MQADRQTDMLPATLCTPTMVEVTNNYLTHSTDSKHAAVITKVNTV